MAIKWNDEKMATGLPEIDSQHKEWIRRFNEFDDAVVNGKGQDTIRNTLGFLEQYAEIHFAHEESSMTRYNSPTQAINRGAHDEFRGKLAEIKAWVEHEGVTTVEVVALKAMLEEWLVNHICTIDVQLRGTDPSL